MGPAARKIGIDSHLLEEQRVVIGLLITDHLSRIDSVSIWIHGRKSIVQHSAQDTCGGATTLLHYAHRLYSMNEYRLRSRGPLRAGVC